MSGVLVTAVAVGLGPLARPEMTILSVAFVAVLVTCRAMTGHSRSRLIGAALTLPVTYEVFRAGYAGPYVLVVPFAAFAVWAALGRRWTLRRTFGGSDGRNLVAAMVGASLVYILYVTRVGGDYMHARMLLIPIFARCCPLAVIAVPRAEQARLVVVGAVVAVAGWAAFVAVAQRAPDPESFFGGHSIAEQRVFYVNQAQPPPGLARRVAPVVLLRGRRRGSPAR